MSNDLLIKINADAKNAEKAFDDVRKQTADLEDQLKTAALVSGVAFAALTAEVGVSIAAFEKQDKAVRLLNQALQTQGLYSAETTKAYQEYAAQIQETTGIGDEELISAQARLQGFIGQTKVTKDLTQAVADLGATMGGDLNSAAELIGKTIGSTTNALGRYGLVLDSSSTEAEKMGKVIQFVQTHMGGFAAAADQGAGSVKGLLAYFGDFQEKIGERFTPVFAAAVSVATDFFKVLNNSPVIADITAALLAAGIAVTGLITAVALGVPAFLALSAAAATFGVSLNLALLGIPLAIGAIVAGATLLALNWSKVMAAMKAAAVAAVTVISEIFGGLGQILSGVMHFDTSQITKGLEQLKESFKKAKDAAVDTYTGITASATTETTKQNEALAKQAAIREAIARATQANLVAIKKNEIELLRLQDQHASADLIKLKQDEIAGLKALDFNKSKEEIALRQDTLKQIRDMEADQRKQDQERTIAFEQVQNETKAEFAARGIETTSKLREDQLATLRAQAQTEEDVDRQLQTELLTSKIKAHNQELLDRKKYGQSVATINKVLNDEEVQGAATAAGELVQLQQSKNATLKTIGTVAAVADIAVKTAQSAMNIYEGFSTIPIIGPALGIAGAAAAVAFGAERTSEVLAAREGGLVEGGIPGFDSVPALLAPGELVVPEKNFEQVVKGASQDNKPADSITNDQVLAVLQSIDGKFKAPQQTVIQGDVMTDDSYIDALVRRISDALQYRNAKLFGVTA